MNGCGFFKNIKVSVFALPLCLTLCVKQSKVKKSIFISYLIKHLEVKMFYLYLFKYITYCIYEYAHYTESIVMQKVYFSMVIFFCEFSIFNILLS